MHAADVLHTDDRRQQALLLAAVLLSLLVHAGLGAGMANIEAPIETGPVWVEMDVIEPPPPPPPPEPEPEPPPEPEPEPPPPPPSDEVVDFEETTDAPVPDPPAEPPPKKARPVRRVVQGLSNRSFVDGATTGLSVNAGTTTAAKATDEKMTREEATEFATVPYQSITTAPRVKARPLLRVPEELRAEGVQGKVDVELTIDGEGRVVDVVVVSGLHPKADAACVRDLKATRWKPGTRDGTPVGVTGVPFSCRYELLD